MIDYTQRPTGLYSQRTLEQWILTIPTVVREELISNNCGTTAGYVLKRVYSRNYEAAPTFKLKIAVGLDKASQGQVDFRDFIEDNESIDWAYLHRVLGQRLRQEALARRDRAVMMQNVVADNSKAA